jgi:hypothetical protein
MTHSELRGKMRIKLKIVADLGLRSRVGFLFASGPLMGAGAGNTAPNRNV